MDGLAEAGLAIWPLALTLASIGVVDRVRAARRRESLNRTLHELRRPLQALLLGRSQANGAAGQVELALAALSRLDAEINGVATGARRRPVRIGALIEAAAERWQGAASIAGRSLNVCGFARSELVAGDPHRLAQALDNLIANALEHGRGPIRVCAVVRDGTVRITVSDAGVAGRSVDVSATSSRGPRRGHGLRIAAAVAAEHGGRIDVRHSAVGTAVALELPASTG